MSAHGELGQAGASRIDDLRTDCVGDLETNWKCFLTDGCAPLAKKSSTSLESKAECMVEKMSSPDFIASECAIISM